MSAPNEQNAIIRQIYQAAANGTAMKRLTEGYQIGHVQAAMEKHADGEEMLKRALLPLLSDVNEKMLAVRGLFNSLADNKEKFRSLVEEFAKKYGKVA